MLEAICLGAIIIWRPAREKRRGSPKLSYFCMGEVKVPQLPEVQIFIFFLIGKN